MVSQWRVARRRNVQINRLAGRHGLVGWRRGDDRFSTPSCLRCQQAEADGKAAAQKLAAVSSRLDSVIAERDRLLATQTATGADREALERLLRYMLRPALS